MSQSSTTTLKYKQNFLGAFQCMLTVISALFLRETLTLYGQDKFGYFWVLLRNVFGIGVFVALRLIMGIEFKEGMHIVFFILSGFVLYFIFAESVSKCMNAISGNAALLSFPHVIPLDLMISRCMLVFFTNIQAGLAIGLIAVFCGIEFSINNYLQFLYCLLAISVLGFTVGLFLSALAVFYSIINHLWIFISRILFFVSGVFFSIDMFPLFYQEILSYNPLLQIIEGFRSSISNKIYLTEHLSYFYINTIIFVTFTLGLLLEKASHRRLEQ